MKCGGRAQQTAEQQEDHRHRDCKSSRFLVLPNELILAITGFLDQESRLLLSLSCRRLRVLLDSHLDLALDDRATKVRFLQILELDHPEYLTCRYCGLLYNWRKREFSKYGCPRARPHQSVDVLVSYAQAILAGDRRCISVSREVVDLILRAHEHGPQKCLPVSFLNRCGHSRDGVSGTSEARLVDGQLILGSRIEVEVESGQGVVTMMNRLMIQFFCIHSTATLGIADKTWQTFEQEALANMTMAGPGTETFKAFKCCFCETDHDMQVKKNVADGTIRIIVHVWRNYGRRYRNKMSSEQIFHRYPVLRLGADTVSQRNLRAVFESQEGVGVF